MTASDWVQVAARGGLQVWRGPGQGLPLVTLHGLEDTWTNWEALTTRLPGYTPYAVQLPWHSGTDYLWRPHGSPSQWMSRAIDLIPEQPAVLMAHSFGATVLLTHLAHAPTPRGLSAVVLIAPVYRPAHMEATADLEDISRQQYREVLRMGLGVALGEKAARMDPDIRALMEKKLLDRAIPAGFHVFYQEFVATAGLHLAHITMPTLVVAGTTDAGLTPERAHALRQAMPVIDLVLRPQYGHFCHLEQPADLSLDINDFLGATTHPTDHAKPREHV